MPMRVPIGQRAMSAALILGALAAALPFAVALSPAKAVMTHLIGLAIIAVAAKAMRNPGRGDGPLLAGVGAFAIVVPVFAWQMPASGAWSLLLLGAATVAIGVRRWRRMGDTPVPQHPVPQRPVPQPMSGPEAPDALD